MNSAALRKRRDNIPREIIHLLACFYSLALHGARNAQFTFVTTEHQTIAKGLSKHTIQIVNMASFFLLANYFLIIKNFPYPFHLNYISINICK